MLLYEKIKKNTDKDFDGIIIMSPVCRQYVTGFKSSAGYVVATKDKTVYFTDFRYYGAACKAKLEGKLNDDVEVQLYDGTFWDKTKQIFNSCRTILVEESFITLETMENIKSKLEGKTLVTGASHAISRLRAVKTDLELAKIKKAQAVTDKAFSYIVDFIADHLGANGITENEVAVELEYFMKKNGADGIAFDTIAVNGKKSAMPHGTPSNIKLKKGFLTMDFGATFDSYCSDMTRTISIGNPTKKMRLVYDTVLKAQLTALDFISSGKTGAEIDDSARRVINSAGFEGCFGHSLGHSLGLEIHESPNFSPSSDVKIPVGAVVSVEPGIYIDGEFGVRIEDIVSVTKNGCINLTKSSKELIIL